MVSALAVVLCSSCDQQAEQQLQTSVLGNYCEVTVLADGSDAVHSDVYDYYSNIVISYEGGSGTNFGTYIVPQQGDVTVSWTYGYSESYDYSETFNVGSAVKMTIVVDRSSASANY